MAESFNPRVRAGRDARQPQEPHRSRVSIHASARDATAGRSGIPSGTCFNPRVRAGRDTFALTPSMRWTRFNPRVRAGRDGRKERHPIGYLFQSTRPRGTRRKHQMRTK